VEPSIKFIKFEVRVALVGAATAFKLPPAVIAIF
jgi:hypothetical protein